jgi:hypothetical protein
MAKSKTQKTNSKTKHVDDDDEQQMKAREEAADEEAVDVDEDATELDVDEEDAEATELDADEPEAEADEEADADDDADKNDTDDDEDEDEESVDEGPVAPPARVTKTALFLILMNWIAAPTFLFMAYTDNMVRLQYSYRTTLNYVQLYGLPLKSEEDVSVSSEGRPYIVLTPEQLKKAFKSRPGVTNMREEFAPFEETIDKRVPFRLRPSDMTKSVLVDIFQVESDKAVPTLDDEIDRLMTAIPAEIENAAKEVKESLAKKTDPEKRDLIKKALAPFSWDSAHAKKIEGQIDASGGADLDAMMKRIVIKNVLFTIAWDVWQVKNLDDKLEKTKAADLDGLLDDAIQRRIYYDILAPINVFRPGDIKDVKNYKIEKLSDGNAYSLEKVKEFMQDRLKAAIAMQHDPDHHLGDHYWTKSEPSAEAQKRDSVERRQKIAFIMFTLSQTSVPVLEKRPLFPKGIERAQIVCGLYEFTNSSIYYVRSLRILEERIVTAVRADRQGLVAELKDKAGQLTNTNGFTREYENEIDRLVTIAAHIDSAEKRKADLTKQKDHYQKIYEQRALQHKQVLDKLLKARTRTNEYVQELKLLQDQLHAALVDLSEAAERNFRLHDEIRAIELGYMNQTKKGGKKQP